MKNNRFNQGNALVEYVLPCALILTIGLVSLPGLTNNFGTALSGVFVKPLPSNTASSGGISGINSPGSGGGLVGGGNTTQGFTGQEGLSIETAGSSGAHANSAIETAGANGEAVLSATRALENLLSGSTPGGTSLRVDDQKLYTLISRMANQGHALASLITTNATESEFTNINAQLASIYAEYNTYSAENTAIMRVLDISHIINANYKIISDNGQASQTVASLQATGNTVTQSSTVANTVTDSSNTICDQGGSNCKK